MKKLTSFILIFALLLTFASFPAFANTVEGQLIQYPTYPEELPRNYDYEVTVTQGDKTITLPVYNASRQINSYHGVKNTDSYRRFCEFAFEGEVTVSVRVKLPMTNYVILPSSKGIESNISGNVITFKLTEPENIALRLNEDDNTILSIFAQAPETDVPLETDEKVIYFKAGYNNLSEHSTVNWTLSQDGAVEIPAGYTVYLEPGALVSARLVTKRSNITVKGRGAFIDPRTDRGNSNYTFMFWARQHSYEDQETGEMIYEEYPSNITLEDVKFLDAHTFNVCFTNVKDVTVNNIKMLSSEISTDGLSFWGKTAENVNIDGVYMYVNDNAFVNSCATSINITNCVVGTNHAIFYPQGTVENIVFDGIDVFSVGQFFRARESMSSNVTWNITAKNIRARDALKMSAFIYIQNQLAGQKTINFENVSLPASDPIVYVVGTTGPTFNCDNVYIGTKTLSSTSLFTKYNGTNGSSYSSVNFNFSTEFNVEAAGVGTYASAFKSASYEGDEVIKIGGYTIPYSEETVITKNGTTYINAVDTLSQLGYTADYTDGTLTFSNEEGSAIVEPDTDFSPIEENGVAMLPVGFFTQVLGLTATYSDGAVNIDPPESGNLLKDGGFEDIHNELLQEGKNIAQSEHWTHFNFGGTYEVTDPELVYSGDSSMRVLVADTTSVKGTAQYITPAIQKYGAGTYRFEAWVRLGEIEDPMAAYVNIGIAQASYYTHQNQVPVGINSFEMFTLTNEWQKISYEVTITDPTLDGYDRAFFFVGNAFTTVGATSEFDFYIDEASLTYIDKIITYPEYPEELPRDYDYEVTLTQGDTTVTIPVYNAARSPSSFSGAGDSFRRFCEFAFEGEVTVKVTPRFRIHAYAVLPSSRGIQSGFVDNSITFTISEPQNLVVRVNDDDNTVLAIFAEAPQTDVPDENDENVIYFKAGLNNSPDYELDRYGRLRIPEGTIVYLEPGALVMARPFVQGSNVTIKGAGAFIDPRLDRYTDYAFMLSINNNVNAEKSEPYRDILVEGVRLLDAHTFNLCFSESENVEINNVKVLSNQISTDSVSMWGSSGTITDINIHDSFFYSSDDMLVISRVDSLTIRDCVFASDYRFLIPQHSIGELLIENVDLFRAKTLLRANSDGEAASWENITLRNIYLEDAQDLEYIINIQNGTDETKNVTLENISLPAKVENGIIIYNTKGVNLTLNNVFMGGEPVDSSSVLPSFIVSSGNTVTFGTSFDAYSARAGYYSIVRGTYNYTGTSRVIIGTAQLPPAKEISFTENGETYVPAVETLPHLGYSAAFENGVLTFSNGDVYTMTVGENALYKNGIKFDSTALVTVDGSAMLPISVLRTLGFTAALDGANVRISALDNGENLIADSGFENLANPYVDNGDDDTDYLFSKNWSAYNFGNLYSTTVAHSGKRSLYVKKNLTTTSEQSGVSQILTTDIRRYGAGVYHIELWAKLGEETQPENPNIRVGIVQGGWRISANGEPISINDYKEFALTTDWQKISYDVVITDTTQSGYSSAYLFIGAAQDSSATEGAVMDFYIDDVSVTYATPATADTLTDTLSKNPTREGEILKGWYDGDGNLVTLDSTVNGTVYLHPEFVKLDELSCGYVDEDGNENDTNEVSAVAKYLNGMYLQGAQVRIGDGVTTGLRFITVNNTDMLTAMTNAGLSGVDYGTLVALGSLYSGEMVLDADGLVDVPAEKILYSAAALNANYQKYTACVVGITSKDFESEIIVRPYIRYTDLSGVLRVLYGEQYGCDLYSAAQVAYNSPDESEETKNHLYNEIISQLS